MIRIPLSIVKMNSPKRGMFSPKQSRYVSLNIDIQNFIAYSEFSKNSIEFSKDNKRQANFNSLYRVFDSLKKETTKNLIGKIREQKTGMMQVLLIGRKRVKI